MALLLVAISSLLLGLWCPCNLAQSVASILLSAIALLAGFVVLIVVVLLRPDAFKRY